MKFTSVLLHMGGHVEIEVVTCRILYFVGLKLILLIFRLQRNGGINFPFTFAVIMDSLFVALWQKWALFYNCVANLFATLKVNANIRII